MASTVFASSLLSLISPWAGSRGGRCRRWRGAGVPPPRVPPPPRRHSLPAPAAPPPAPPAPPAAPPPRPDLRQELRALGLGTQEFHSWLGHKYEDHEHDRFDHDIPLQRSISLDRGVDIFHHLKTLGSNCSGSVGSLWTVDSDGRDSLAADRCRSLEDIPTSPYRVRSRRASYGVETFSERDLAMAVLSASYKGLASSSGSISPQIKKLQRCFTFSGTIDSIKDSRGSIENLRVNRVRSKLKLVIPNMTDTNSCPVSPEIRRLRNFAFRDSAEDENRMSDDEDQGLEVQEPAYRSISVEWTQGDNQRKIGFQSKNDLRKAVLVRQEFKSSESLSGRHRGSLELAESKAKVQRHSNLGQTRRNVSIVSNTDRLAAPSIIISRADTDPSVANISNTSNYVEISRNCDCRICTRDSGRCFVKDVLSKLFVKLLSCREYSRKYYWDENNNLNANEMYNCIMQILKLLFGLWLRHHDHRTG